MNYDLTHTTFTPVASNTWMAHQLYNDLDGGPGCCLEPVVGFEVRTYADGAVEQVAVSLDHEGVMEDVNGTGANGRGVLLPGDALAWRVCPAPHLHPGGVARGFTPHPLAVVEAYER
ncbi:hypothetical protein [Dermacoccus barathri]|uniref:Uncharacterized protein n=1 Tax=Dermacoccus barathri TaxID=322601 RepID=A0ABN2C5N6_9MICO